MLKRDITYTNPFTEQEATETHFFHISKADLVEMELEEHGKPPYLKDGEELTGMQAKLQKIVDSQDGKAIIAEFKDIIRRSYGVKDGERFRKTAEAWEDFASSEAFSQLLFELCTQADSAAEFMNGVIPNNLDKIADDIKKQAESVAAGREAQAEAKAAGAASTDGQLSEGTAAAMEALTPEPVAATPEEDTPAVEDASVARMREIHSATPTTPATITRAEATEMDSNELQSGLVAGRYKLA